MATNLNWLVILCNEVTEITTNLSIFPVLQECMKIKTYFQIMKIIILSLYL